MNATPHLRSGAASATTPSMTIHEAGGPTPFPASVAGPSGKVRGDMNHRTGLIDTELAAFAVIRDSGTAEIVLALRPRGLLTATDRQVLARNAEDADATARTARRPRRSAARITRRSPRRTALYSSAGTLRVRVPRRSTWRRHCPPCPT